MTAAFLSTLSTAMEIVEPMVKHGIENIAAANTIKFIGSNAGMLASALNLGVDISDLISEVCGRRRWQFIGLYGVKIIPDALLTVKAFDGLLGMVVKRTLFSSGGLIAEGVVSAVVWETIAWLCSWQVMLAIFLVEELVTYFSDNNLQEWCRSCVFGLEPTGNLKSTQWIYPESQKDKLYEEQKKKFC